MAREYPTAISCPTCGEMCPRHCVKNQKCGWFFCLAETSLHELGQYNSLTRKWKVRKTRRWTSLR